MYLGDPASRWRAKDDDQTTLHVQFDSIYYIENGDDDYVAATELYVWETASGLKSVSARADGIQLVFRNYDADTDADTMFRDLRDDATDTRPDTGRISCWYGPLPA